VLVGGCLEVGDVGLPYVPVVAALRGFAAEADNERYDLKLWIGSADGSAAYLPG